jgi:hypothetical protein
VAIFGWFLLIAAQGSAMAEQSAVRPTTICIRVEAPSLPKNVVLNTEAIVTDLLKQAQFSIVPTALSCDAALEIQVKGKPLSERYSMFRFSPGGNTHYSGAEVEVTLLLESSKTSSTKQAHGKVVPPDTIEVSSYLTPDDAPYRKALDDSNLYVMLGSAIQEVLGAESVVGFWLSGRPEA